MARRPKIVYRRLGKEPPKSCKCHCPHTDYGRWKGDIKFRPANGVISVDPRQPDEELLDTLIHELMHDAAPFLEEFAVCHYASHIAEALWREGWRPTKKLRKQEK